VNLIELQHALRQLRLGGIATVLETRLHQAQAEFTYPGVDQVPEIVTVTVLTEPDGGTGRLTGLLAVPGLGMLSVIV
jgi:hypothetical protein